MNTDLKPGQEVDGFRIDSLLGQGSSSEVVLAHDPDGLRVVLKLPRDAAVASPKSFDRFRRELQIVARLDHPGIERSIDRRTARSRPYLVMEYVEGETLAARLERDKRFPVDLAVGFAIQLAEALAYAHEHGVVHRDVKPGNVLVAGGDRLVIMDFGIALLDGARRLTFGLFGDRLGTPDYMSPEQIQGKRGDPRSDIYALGAVLFEMLTGRAPWQGQDTMEVINQHLTAPFPPMANLGVEVPPAVEGIVRRCLRKRPEERYADAAALRHDLEHWQELEPAQFELAEEPGLAPAEEHLLLLVVGICFAFLAISTLLVTATYLVAHH